MTDPIADLLTRIRNAYLAKKASVRVPHSKAKEALTKVLAQEGYLEAYALEGEGIKQEIVITLKYEGPIAVIKKIDRISSPGRRTYLQAKYIKPVLGGHGMLVISTSKGLLTDKQAKKENLGGEVLCRVY
jgi:small subunit ribosomal protein S8